jgi:ligand-binding sensor domain-containing protein/signal transduction histidine kinase
MHYSIYDPVTELFERNVSKELEKYFGFNKGVEQLYIDAKKNFWVKFYDEGLYYYNPNTKKVTHFNLGYGDNELNPTYNFTAYSTCDDGVMMVTSNGELVCFDGEKGKKMYDDKWMREHGSPENKEYHLCVDKDRNIWVSAENNTYVCVDKDGQWRIGYSTLFREYQIENVPEDLQVWDLKVDGKGRIWLATDHEGLLVVDLKNHEMRQFLNNKFDESSISENTLRNIYMDSHGLAWIGSFKNGVNMYREASASMINLELGDINAVSEDRFGNYWLGTNDRGILVYNPKRQEIVAHYTKENSPMWGNIMVGTCRASDGSIWFGGYNSGLTRCIPKNDNGEATIINYHYTGESGGIATDNVWSVTEDKWHRIWLGTLGSGIQMLDLKTGKFRTWDTSNTKINANYVTSASWIKKGWLMMGTSWYWCFVNPVTGKLCPRELPGYELFPVQSGNTVSVMEDSRGIIWQGSFCGVIAFDQQRKTTRLLDMQDGLLGSSVCSIIEDQQHHIWIVTDHGVSKVVPHQQEDGSWQFNISSYNDRDGLQKAVYNQRSTCLTHDGKILIGGQGGLDIINTKLMTDVKSKERPIFSGLQLFDADVPVGREIDGRIILDEALEKCREITLNFNDQFTILLASDAGIVNNGKRFVYKLEGFNDNWVKTSENNPTITYNSLRDGDYTLCVRMLNDDGSIGEEEAQLEITILPAFWRRRWAFLLYVIAVAGIALLWRRWYMKRQDRRMETETIRRELEKKQWINEQRLQLKKEFAEKSSAASHSDEVSADNSVVARRHLGDIVSFLRQFCEDYVPQDKSKRVKVNFFSPMPELETEYDANLLAEALQILFNNSVLFAHDDCIISVGVTCQQDGQVQMQVADNGIGIKDEYKAHAFDSMTNDEGIGLDRVKAVIDAHEGTIRIQDNPGGGTIFVITLPKAEEIEEAVVLDD